MKTNNYNKFFLMLAISFCVMYGVMFLNVDQADHIYLSETRTYMSLLMVTPMAILMLLMMPDMYMNKTINGIILAAGIMVFAASLILLRTQTLVGDKQYMKAMIPHHSSAIMTSKHANIKDPELKTLSQSIIKSQQEEIEQMKRILKRLDQ
jgi:uncharacterized protein (DUF305 family)